MNTLDNIGPIHYTDAAPETYSNNVRTAIMSFTKFELELLAVGTLVYDYG